MDYFVQLKPKLTYLSADKVEIIHRAYLLANRAHTGQKRHSGEEYISHPMAVAGILADMQMDCESIASAILHDVLEDTPVDKKAVRAEFGEAIANLVDGVSKLTQIKFSNQAEAQAENFRKMLLAMVKDIRVILIKLSDRLHNMRTLGSLALYKRQRIARETLDIYAPIANRLGMHSIKIELEDLCFKALNPMRYQVLSKAVKKARGNRKEIVNIIQDGLQEALKRNHVTAIKVQGREKHLYSIYKKMRQKHLPFSEIMDVYAFRITVDSMDNCYRALGAIHNLYKPLPERFKDYIAMPKANGYQSLHTTLFGPYGVPIEIQIRTMDMHHAAESGIASHWLYKSDEDEERVVSEAQTRARVWLKNLLDLQKNTGSSIEFLENVKIDLFPDEVYVFTPKGKIMELPGGATAVDFAYAIHSDIGNSCIAAKIDRHLAPLSSRLKNGQTVEVITAPGARPNPAWLGFVVTGKARSHIRHMLKNQQRSDSLEFGKRLLDKALGQLSRQLKEFSSQQIEMVAQEFGVKNPEELFAGVGVGKYIPLVIARRLIESSSGKIKASSAHEEQPLTIKGTEGMVVQYADCCCPIPGDAIVGYLQSGRGMIVHVDTCKQVERFRQDPEHMISLCWADDIHGEFKSEVVVEVENKRGVLAQLATAIAEAEANIDDIRVDPSEGNYNIVYITVSVRSRVHLARVIRRIRAVHVVARVFRK